MAGCSIRESLSPGSGERSGEGADTAAPGVLGVGLIAGASLERIVDDYIEDFIG